MASGWWPVAVIILAGCVAYSNTLRNPFIFDDHETIVDNQQIRDLGNLETVLTPIRELPTAGRPVVSLTFAINYALGGVDVTGYHVWNVATHLMCALLLFAVVRRTLARQNQWVRDRSQSLALAVALLWTVHPLNTDAVDYITQRTELTMAATLLLTLYASIRALEARHRAAWSAVAILACALGMASKESMVTAPILVVLYDRVFVFRSAREVWAARKSLYLGLTATWLVLAGLLWSGPRRDSAGFSTGVSPLEYLLNQGPIIARYLWLSFVPYSLVQNYGSPRQVTFMTVLPAAALVGGLVVLTIAAFRIRPKRAFLGAWIWITLAPASSIVPIATEVGAERRMYLPLMAVMTLAVLALAAALERFGRRAQIVALTLVATTFIAATFVRNIDYSSPIVLARKTLERYPTPVGQHVLATELLAVGQREEAMQHLRLAVPGAPRAHYSLGVELLDDGKLDEGIAELREFIRDEPRLGLVVDAHEYMGKAYAQRGQWREAMVEFQTMLALAPGNLRGERLLADASFDANDMASAVAHYSKYVAREPDDASVFNQFGVSLASTGRLDDAIAMFVRAEQANPQDGSIERNLSYTLYQKHDLAGALVHAERAVALQPDDEGSRALLRMLHQSR